MPNVQDNDSKTSISFPIRLVVTGFFSGYSPVIPGTMGTAFSLCIYWLLPPLSPLAWILFLVVLFFVGVYTSSVGEVVWGKDPSYVVIDEFFGFFVTVCFLPPSVELGILGFFLFRILDVVKPPPARQSEALSGGLGVMTDDLIAGVYGNLILHGVLGIFNW